MRIIRHVVPVLLALALPWLIGCGHHRASCCETGPLPGGETASVVAASPANAQLSPAPTAALPSGTPAAGNAYGGQKHCPVTGEELDPAGGAIPVTVRGQTIYVCCQGCVGKVKKNPDLYLAKVRADVSAR